MSYTNARDIDLAQPQRDALAQVRSAQTAYDFAANTRIAAVTLAREQGLTWDLLSRELDMSPSAAKEHFRKYL
jgi:hypothetical protein